MSPTVLMIGYFGHGNAGDDAILLCLESKVTAYFPRSRMVCLDPKRRWWSFLKEVKQADLVIFGGGSLFQNYTSQRSLLFYSAVAILTRYSGKPLVALGQGLGPLKGAFGCWIFKKAQSCFNHFCVRDQVALDSLQSMGLTGRLTADLLYSVAQPKRVLFAPKKLRRLGLAIHGLKKNHIETAAFKAAFQLHKEWQPIVCDKRFDPAYFQQILPKQSASFLYLDTLLALKMQRTDISVLVSMRYHACVWASLLAVPFIAIGADPKIKAIAEEFGCPWLETVNKDTLSEAILSIEQDYQGVQCRMQARLATVMKREKRHNDIVASFFSSTVPFFDYQISKASPDRLVSEMKTWQGRSKVRRIVTFNPEMFMAAKRDSDVAAWIQGADLILPDGQGIVWGVKMLNKVAIRALPGIEFVSYLFQHTSFSFYLVGAAEDVIQQAATCIKASYPHITILGVHSGYFDFEQEAELLLDIESKQPDIVLCGMGFLRQEAFIKVLSERPKTGCIAMGVGGAFDVFSKRIQRAPSWMRDMRLEWLYRGLREPKRVFRWGYMWRYVRVVLITKLRKKRGFVAG